MAIEIQPGDVVILKSGGPAMTVTAVSEQYGVPSAWCAWFEKTKNHNGVFPLVAVQKYD
jgi:uncharacterized protein YodC (DUF2158 family)